MGFIDQAQLQKLAAGMGNEYGVYLREVAAHGREER